MQTTATRRAQRKGRTNGKVAPARGDGIAPKAPAVVAAVALAPVPPGGGALVAGVQAAREYAAAALAPNTVRAYAADWRAWLAWCDGAGVEALPADPAALAVYLSELAQAGKRANTLTRYAASVATAHRRAGYKAPTEDERVRAVLRGIRRTHGTAPRQAQALAPAALRAMAAALPANARGLRDRAMLCLGWAAALRRSELVALDVEDLALVEEGAEVRIRRSKTDQEGEGATVAVPYGGHPESCPVRALRAWLAVRPGPSTGPLFPAVTAAGVVTDRRTTDRAVDRALKRAAALAGLRPAAGVRLSAHGLRAGLATAAAAAGVSDRRIMAHGRWRSRTTVDRYVRAAGLWNDCAAKGLL